MASEARDDRDGVTVETYHPSDYTPADWPVVSDVNESAQFIPSSFDTVAESIHEIDAMFADFGSGMQEPIELSKEAGDFDLQPVVEVDVEQVSAVSDRAETDVRDSLDVACEEKLQDLSRSDYDGVERDSGCSDLEDEVPPIQEAVPADGEASEDTSDKSLHINEGSLRSALEESYERGCVDARREVAAVQVQLEDRYRLLWEDMQTQLDESLRLNEMRAVDLALQVAKRLVGDVVEHQRGYIHHVIREAIKVAAGAEISSIRVSPRDYDFLKLADYGDSRKFISGAALKFISDESIRAGCVLVTSAGEVDYDLDGAWERIRSKAQQEPES
jgi:flagellar biosynthesis/type III secretory pathway protein FliH